MEHLPWPAILVGSFLLYLLVQSFRISYQQQRMDDLTISPSVILYRPLFLLVSCYAILLTLTAPNITPIHFVFPLYLLAATSLVWVSTVRQLSFGIPEIIAALMLWLPFDFRWIIRNWGAKESYGFSAIAASILAIHLFVFLRKVEDMKINFDVSWRDVGATVKYLAVVAAILIPLGMAIDFMAPGIRHDRLVYTPIIFIGICLLIALPEELLFRAVLQNIFSQTLGRPTTALVVTSIIFGAAHLNNGSGGWSPALWNWKYMFMASIAGYFYGRLFMRSRSIWPAIWLHAGVDTVWHTFFAGK